ncbi:hypothetical protein I79_010412 [Cricetulus griseus]|uniref:Uncharacterized protein n=1 Tax=Cricetulus griseus TaxID=10029 RepID=G3HIF1_CRIGR|nr:hypothetical protein I79_010412 [Cricetulus griseus]
MLWISIKAKTRATWLANHTPVSNFPSSHQNGDKERQRGTKGFKGLVCTMEKRKRLQQTMLA